MESCWASRRHWPDPACPRRGRATAESLAPARFCATFRARAMLTISNISKSYGGRVLFEDVSLQVNRGDKIGLVGPNGAGKTTLFSIILGEEPADEGKVFSERGVTIGYLPQE